MPHPATRADMTPAGNFRITPLHHLAYFTEWGGRTWESLTRLAITQLQKDDALNGADLLDIGTRYGKMAVLFHLLGATVTGIDIHEQPLDAAREEARKWGASSINFMVYDGDLDVFADETFDIVFTKSVLVVVSDLETYLRKISNKLRPNGRVVFLENARGNALIHALRAIRHRGWNYHYVRYFTETEVKLLKNMFHIDTTIRTRLPPAYLFLGRKRA